MLFGSCVPSLAWHRRLLVALLVTQRRGYGVDYALLEPPCFALSVRGKGSTGTLTSHHCCIPVAVETTNLAKSLQTSRHSYRKCR